MLCRNDRLMYVCKLFQILPKMPTFIRQNYLYSFYFLSIQVLISKKRTNYLRFKMPILFYVVQNMFNRSETSFNLLKYYFESYLIYK